MAEPVELRHLAALVAVADEGTITAAATRLGVAQPTLSAALRRLERRVGARLLVRGARASTLTPAGRVLVDQARGLLAAADQAVAAARRAAAPGDEEIRVGTLSYALPRLPELALLAYSRSAPQVRVVPTPVVDGGESLRRLRRPLDAADALDLAFVRFGTVHGGDLVAERLLDEPLVVALPAAHPLTGRERLEPRDLVDVPLALYPRAQDPSWHDAVLDAVGAHGGARLVHEGVSAFDNLPLVRRGHAVTLMSASFATVVGIDGVVYRPLDGPLTLPLSMVHRAGDARSAVAELTAVVRRQAALAAPERP